MNVIRRLIPSILVSIASCSGASTAASPGVAKGAGVEAGAVLVPGPIAFPDGFMTSVKSYGAVGDGVTDDTASIQKALSDGRLDAKKDYYYSPKALYFPPGVYLVRDTLQWVGCCVTIQGSGTSSTIIRLAPHSNGFGDPSNPKPLILTSDVVGNEAFHQNIWDLSLEVGANNAGATALNYVSNNSGSVHDVLITSEDGKGHAGIDLTRKWAGPLLIRNTEIRGFDIGVDLQFAIYGSTFESISLEHQNLVGIRNVDEPISIRGLLSTNEVPALTNSGGFVVLLDADLEGGNPDRVALQTNSTMYLRNITSRGYRATLKDTSGTRSALTVDNISEHLVGSPKSLQSNVRDTSLNLDVEETPSFPSSSPNDWTPLSPNWRGDASDLQSVFNSGKQTIYFPFGVYSSNAEASVIVPDTVNRIIGFSSVVSGNPGGINGGGIRLVITGKNKHPLIIEQFGFSLKIDHRGSRPLVIKDAMVNYTSAPGAGTLFLEDVEMLQPLVVQEGQKVWARQLNDEVSGTKVSNYGGTLWILGLKTEGAGTVIDTSHGGQTELLGSLVYPATRVPQTDVAFSSTDAQVSYMYTEPVYCELCGYSVQAQEIRLGKTFQITSPANAGYRMSLFVGYDETSEKHHISSFGIPYRGIWTESCKSATPLQ
jgi:pectate lyase-like protein